MSFFRYPGGKSKLSSQIISRLNKMTTDDIQEYREPFFGGGSIGIKFLESSTKIKECVLNDFDGGIAALWYSVLHYPEQLKEMVKGYSPTVDDFFRIKRESLTPRRAQDRDAVVTYGFEKLVIHQISYSGLGTKSGSPLGGKNQNSKYKVDCRWSPDYIMKKIDKLHALLSKFDCCVYSKDFSSFILGEGAKSLVYLDPPYYGMGNDLYQFGFTHQDHVRLSTLLKETKHSWLLSYDDCPEVRELYNWALIEEIAVNYSITGSRNKKELLIHL